MLTIGLPTLSEEDISDSGVTSGLDGIRAFIANDCHVVFAPALSISFNLALKTCTFPVVLRKARDCPVFRNGNSFNQRREW